MTQVVEQVGLTSSQVCHRAQVTYRQLQRWCDLGVLVPSVAFRRGSGSAWRYSETDVAVVRVCGRLSLLGATLSTISRAVEEIEFRGYSMFDRFEWMAVTLHGQVVFGGPDVPVPSMAWVVPLR